MEVDVRAEIMKIKAKEKNQKIAEKEDNKRNKKVKLLIAKTPRGIRPPKKQFIPIPEQINREVPELSNGAKSTAIKLLSYPAGQKRLELEQRLKGSEYIGNYIDKKLFCNLLRLNDDLKFLAVYGYHFGETCLK